MARSMEIKTPLAADALLFHSMSANEELGRPFEYRIAVLGPKSDIKAEDLLGKNVTVKVELPDGTARFFDSCVTRFALVGGVGRYFHYQITGRPWLWLLTRSADCRIFQNQKVPDIVQAVFNKYPNAKFESRLAGEYRPWEYCVQYRETDFDFVSRLMEQEGIYYYFKHESGKHTLVLCDSYDAHACAPGFEKFAFLPQSPDTPRQKTEVIEAWEMAKRIEPGACAIDDYDFERPSVDLRTTYKDPRKHAEADYEVYDWPGEYIEKAEGEHFVRTRLEERLAKHEVCTGAGPARSLASGNLFKLVSHPRGDQNREYLVTRADYAFHAEGYEPIRDEPDAVFDHLHELNAVKESRGRLSGDKTAAAGCLCAFAALPSNVPFRPVPSTRKQRVSGPQTAVVVGPSGDEIYTDKYGRVKVQFHWDRYGKKNENSSCWIRVSHPWAGSNWGAIHIPRIGQEVIVDFLEGDPDQPIITGRIYNAEQMPPWELPANKTQSGVLTRSSQGGAGANANAIRFEDKKGAEQLWTHAEKNQDSEVENDETHWVGHDRKKTVDHDETTQIKHDRTELVGSNEKITIGANRTEHVGANETVTIGGNRTVAVLGFQAVSVDKAAAESVKLAKALSIGLGYQVSVGAAMNESVGGAKATEVAAYRTEKVALYKTSTIGKSYAVDVNGTSVLTMKDDGAIDLKGKEIKLHTGKGSLLIKDDGTIEITGTEITLKTGGGSIAVKNDGTIAVAGTDCTTKAGAGKVHIDAGGIIDIKGPMVKINT